MNVEHRLHHAARELREVVVETPPLVTVHVPLPRSGPIRRIPALVAPVLFALGGLVMVAGGVRPDQPAPDGPAPERVVAESPAADAPSEAPPTPGEELRIIASLAALATPPAPAPTAAPPVVRPGPIGVV